MGSTLHQGRTVTSLPPEEEETTETTCDEVTTTLIPYVIGREEVESLGAELSPGRSKGWEEGSVLDLAVFPIILHGFNLRTGGGFILYIKLILFAPSTAR